MTSKTPSGNIFYALLEDNGNHHIFYDKKSRRDNIAAPFVYLREAIEKEGLIFKPTFDYTSFPNAAFVLSFHLLNQTIIQTISNMPKEKCFLIVSEPPVQNHAMFYDKRLTNYFGKIFTFYDELADNKYYFKYYHEQYAEDIAENVPDFNDKKFSLMIHSNHHIAHPRENYSERRKIANFFQDKEGLDIYGARWEGFRSWKGVLGDGKVECIKKYKFCFALENLKNQYGCISNKLIEVFYAKTIPVYYGPVNVTDYIPKESFINLHDYTSYNDVYLFMKSMDRKTYENYIEAGQEFIKSPKSETF